MRPGHHRPLGTTTNMRFEWGDGPHPRLEDFLVQVSAAGADDASYVRRAYRVVGFLDGRDDHHFRLVLERIAFEEVAESGREVFGFFNLPRGR